MNISDAMLPVLRKVTRIANKVVNEYRDSSHKIKDFEDLENLVEAECQARYIPYESMDSAIPAFPHDTYITVSHLEEHGALYFWSRLAKDLAKRDTLSLAEVTDGKDLEDQVLRLENKYLMEFKVNGIDHIRVVGYPRYESTVLVDIGSITAINDALTDMFKKLISQDQYLKILLADGNHIHVYFDGESYVMISRSEEQNMTQRMTKGKMITELVKNSTNITRYSWCNKKTEPGDNYIYPYTMTLDNLASSQTRKK